MKFIHILLIFLFLTTSLFSQEKRVALIIGNAAYEHSGRLKNPVNDANLMAETLETLGFTVIKYTDATKSKMERSIYEFSSSLDEHDVALFYYAGHGVQVDGANYLIPVDAQIDDPLATQFEAIDLSRVVSQFEQYQNNTNIVILDACRNDPFKTWSRGGSRGFKAVTAPSGTIIAYATGAGSTAADGDGQNGLYTKVLVEEMYINQRIEDVFIQTRNKVRQLSDNAQSPQEWSQLTGKFYFNSKYQPVATNMQTQRNLSNTGFNSNLTLVEHMTNGTKTSDLLKNGYHVHELMIGGYLESEIIGAFYSGGYIFDIDDDGHVWIVDDEDFNNGTKFNWSDAKAMAKRPLNGELNWKLPNKNQLFLIYTGLKKKNIGGFKDTSYWSASESSYSNAWGISFSSGSKYDFNKHSEKIMRLVKIVE
ncbi:MAG: caspase family protein [Reichenbachiella sp.]